MPSDLPCLHPAPRVILLPGWRNSGPEHWQSRWERRHGDVRIEQDDWEWPRRGDWMIRLEELLLGLPQPPGGPGTTLLVAHSLGCHLVAAWAAHSVHTDRVTAALLVAPPDLARDDLPPQLASWRAAPSGRLPFASRVVCSSDDPYSTTARSLAMAASWGSEVTALGACGHLNEGSKLGDWSEGRLLLQSFGKRRH